MYFAGDGAKKDEDGDIWLLGRVDDVMLVSGHNISTTEVESALVSPPEGRRGGGRRRGRRDDRPGHRGVRHPARHAPSEGDESWSSELRDHVAKDARPDRQAEADPAGGGAAEDPVRQDHAPAAARRRGEPRARRRHHADRLLGDGPDPEKLPARPARTEAGAARARGLGRVSNTARRALPATGVRACQADASACGRPIRALRGELTASEQRTHPRPQAWQEADVTGFDKRDQVCREVWSASERRLSAAPTGGLHCGRACRHAAFPTDGLATPERTRPTRCAPRPSAACCCWSPRSPRWSGRTSPLSSYEALRDFHFGPEPLGLDLSVEHWAADGLLAIFFFVAGIELKRELVAGELRDPGRPRCPSSPPLCGMAVPALVYLAGQHGRPAR